MAFWPFSLLSPVGPQFSILLSLHPASSGYKWPSSFLPPSSRLRSLLLCSNCKKNPFTSSSSPLSRSPRWSLCPPLRLLPPSAQQLRWECHGTWPAALPPSLIDSRGSHSSIALTTYHSEPAAWELLCIQLGGCRPPSCPCQPLPRFFHPTISSLPAHALAFSSDRLPASFTSANPTTGRI